jgi:hypothetical protein
VDSAGTLGKDDTGIAAGTTLSEKSLKLHRSMSMDSRNSDSRILAFVGVFTSIAAILISLVALGISGWQAWIGQRGYDRTVGKVAARLELVRISPSIEEISPAMKAPVFGDRKEVWFNSLKQLIAMNPTLTIRNGGDEAIGALRVETQFLRGIIDNRDEPTQAIGEPDPWVFDQSDRKDYALSRPLRPGETASIPISPGLLAQLLQAQNPKLGHKPHFGVFKIEYYGKLIGLDHFDQSDTSTTVGMAFVWIPNGFPEADARRFLQDFKPAVEIGER